MTVLDVIQRSSEFLTRKGVDSPRLQIELLLAHVLKMPRMKLYLNFDRPLQDSELAALREMVRRRGEREPLQHLVGSTSFCGFEIAVSRDVLIPRPETEQLAERAWEFLGQAAAAAAAAGRPPAALDFATGSGCLAIALATQCPAAVVQAVDISEAALAVARANVGSHQLGERITFHLGDGLGAVPPGMKFDLIVSNPPYIPSGEIAALEPEVRDFDPRLALDGGEDGLRFYRVLAAGAGALLEPGGRLMLEFGDGQAESLGVLFGGAGWEVDPIVKDDSGRERILIARRSN